MNWVGLLKEILEKDRSCSAPMYSDIILSGQPHVPEMEMSITVWKLGTKLTENFKKSGTNKKELKQQVAKMMLDRLNVRIPNPIVESPQVVHEYHQQYQPMPSTSCTTRLDQPLYSVTYSGFEHVEATLQSKRTGEEHLLSVPIPSTSNQNIYNGASVGAEMNDVNTSVQEFIAKKNYKGALQDFCVANKYTIPVYTVLEHSGPSHRPIFKVQCTVDQKYTLEETRQEPKKQVEQRLAYMMLNLLTPEKSNSLGNATEERSTKLCEFMEEEGLPPVEQGNFNLEYKIISVDQIPGSSNAVIEINLNGQKYSFYGDGPNKDNSMELAKQNAEYFISDVMSRSSGNLSVLSK